MYLVLPMLSPLAPHEAVYHFLETFAPFSQGSKEFEFAEQYKKGDKMLMFDNH